MKLPGAAEFVLICCVAPVPGFNESDLPRKCSYIRQARLVLHRAGLLLENYLRSFNFFVIAW